MQLKPCIRILSVTWKSASYHSKSGMNYLIYYCITPCGYYSAIIGNIHTWNYCPVNNISELLQVNFFAHNKASLQTVTDTEIANQVTNEPQNISPCLWPTWVLLFHFARYRANKADFAQIALQIQ